MVFGAKTFLSTRPFISRPQPFTPIQEFGFSLIESFSFRPETVLNTENSPGNNDGRVSGEDPPVLAPGVHAELKPETHKSSTDQRRGLDFMDYTTKHGNCKAAKTPYLRLFTADWIVGTAGLTFEQKGFYLEALLRMWERKDGLPNDDKWLASALQCNPRTVRKLKAELIGLGKLQIDGGKLVNPRMMREIGFTPNSSPIGAELEPNSARIEPELEPNAPENQTNTTRVPARALHFHIHSSDSEDSTERGESRSSAPPLGFAGQFVQLSEEDLAELKSDFPSLAFPADLKTADCFLAAAPPFSDPPERRLVRLRQYLGKRHAERVAWGRKPTKPATGGLRAVSDRVKAEARAAAEARVN